MDPKMMEKLMSKKDQEPLDPMRKEAKMSMLQALLQEMRGMQSGDLHGLKKVSVAAPDKEGLAEGLDKAKTMLGDASAGDESKDEDDDSDFGEDIADHDDTEEHAGEDGKEDHGVDLSGLDPEKLEALLTELKMKLGK